MINSATMPKNGQSGASLPKALFDIRARLLKTDTTSYTSDAEQRFRFSHHVVIPLGCANVIAVVVGDDVVDGQCRSSHARIGRVVSALVG